jgi:hypothetical protein
MRRTDPRATRRSARVARPSTAGRATGRS